MQLIRLNISGMSCEGCAASIRQALSDVRNVNSVAVDLKSGIATIESSDDSSIADDLIRAAKSAGFGATVRP